MELFQVFWDDQKNIFLEFKKDEKEVVEFLPINLKRLTFQFELAKIIRNDVYYKQAPILVSIRKIYHSHEFLCFKIELDQVQDYDDLQITVLSLTIFLSNNTKIEYAFTEKFNISEIGINEDCCDGFEPIDLNSNRRQHRKITKEKVFREVKRDLQQQKEESRIIYEKDSIESFNVDDSMLSLMKENNEALKSIASYLKELTLTLQNMPLNAISYGPSTGTPQRIPGPAIERNSKPELNNLILGGGSSAKVLVIREMKEKFQKTIEIHNGFSIKDILKPMNDDELKAITLDEETLRKKEQVSIQNQIKRLEKKQGNKIELEGLKKPN
ncbi:MAG: hypothetical protein ACFFKA_20645 [Candidatus Thorarchaeota archaeon]